VTPLLTIMGGKPKDINEQPCDHCEDVPHPLANQLTLCGNCNAKLCEDCVAEGCCGNVPAETESEG